MTDTAWACGRCGHMHDEDRTCRSLRLGDAQTCGCPGWTVPRATDDRRCPVNCPTCGHGLDVHDSETGRCMMHRRTPDGGQVWLDDCRVPVPGRRPSSVPSTT